MSASVFRKQIGDREQQSPEQPAQRIGERGAQSNDRQSEIGRSVGGDAATDEQEARQQRCRKAGGAEIQKGALRQTGWVFRATVVDQAGAEKKSQCDEQADAHARGNHDGCPTLGGQEGQANIDGNGDARQRHAGGNGQVGD